MRGKLRQIVVAVIGYAIAISVSIAVMVYGWGLHPDSWLIVIGGSTAGILIGCMFIELAKGEE